MIFKSKESIWLHTIDIFYSILNLFLIKSNLLIIGFALKSF